MATMTTMTTSTRTDDLMAQLQGLVTVMNMTKAGIDEMAVRAHDAGHSWPEVARVIGVNVQTAYRNYAPCGHGIIEREREKNRRRSEDLKRGRAVLRIIDAAAMR